jgi:hypothetical protein
MVGLGFDVAFPACEWHQRLYARAIRQQRGVDHPGPRYLGSLAYFSHGDAATISSESAELELIIVEDCVRLASRIVLPALHRLRPPRPTSATARFNLIALVRGDAGWRLIRSSVPGPQTEAFRAMKPLCKYSGSDDLPKVCLNAGFATQFHDGSLETFLPNQ